MPKVLSNSEMTSQLPSFLAKRSQDFEGWLIVTCPREDCGDLFLVRAKRFYAERRVRDVVIFGRPCPYCFRAARLPDRRRIR